MDRLEIVASQQPDVRERTRLTANETDRAAWTVATDGVEVTTKVGGARAVGLALAVGRTAAWPTLAWKLPVLPWILDRIYELIAANRHRLPGETPWCESHPGDC